MLFWIMDRCTSSPTKTRRLSVMNNPPMASALPNSLPGLKLSAGYKASSGFTADIEGDGK